MPGKEYGIGEQKEQEYLISVMDYKTGGHSNYFIDTKARENEPV